MTDTQDTHGELALPQFEDRLWHELSDLHRTRRRPHWRRPGRRALAAAGAVTAAAVAVTALVLVSGGEGPVPGPAPRPAAAVVVERVLEATDPAAADAVVHETTTMGEGIDVTEAWYDEVTYAMRRRITTAEGDPLVDRGWPEPPTVDEPRHPDLRDPATTIGQCDPGTRLMLDAEGRLQACDPGAVPPQPQHAERAVDHCAGEYVDSTAPIVTPSGFAYLRMFLETGDIVADGTERQDGRDYLVLRNHDASYTFLVDPETYLPIRQVVTAAGGEPEVTAYEHMPRTPETLALLSPPVPEGFVAGSPAAPGACEANPPAPAIEQHVDAEG